MFRPDHRDLADPHLADLGDQGLLVVDREDGDLGTLRRVDRLLDPPHVMLPPRLLHERDVVPHPEVQGVVPPEVLGALDDHPRDPEPVREVLVLRLLHPDPELHPDLLPALRPEFVRRGLLPPVRDRPDEVPGLDQVVEVPEVVRVLDLELDSPLFRVLVEDAHRPRNGGSLFLRIEFCVALCSG